MLYRNVKLSTIPPPSQQHFLTCSNITTSAAAQFAGHQVLSKDRICNWTLHSKDQQLQRGCWSPSPSTKARRGRDQQTEGDLQLDQPHVQGMQHMCHATAHWGGESQACSPSAECTTSGSVQRPVCPAVHPKEVVRHSCWDLGRKLLKCRSPGFSFTGEKIQEVAPS